MTDVMTDASASVHHSVQNATILTTGVLLTERQLQILSSAFPHLAGKLADRATGVAVASSSNTMMNYLAQYTMDLSSRAEQTPAEFWRQRDNGSVIPLVALDLISILHTGFAGIRGKTVFCLQHANDRQEKQDEEISTHEILAESEL